MGIGLDFEVSKVTTEEKSKEINIHLNYLPKRYTVDRKDFPIYDQAPERKWQHFNWFEYKCYILCSIPRYVNSDGKVTTIDIDFAPKSRSYTNKISQQDICYLQTVRVQSTVANLLNTSSYIVRSIMEDAVQNALSSRGFITDFKHVSLDEKAYKPGNEYATILIDSDKDCVLNLVEGRKEKSVKSLFFELNEQENQPQIELVNIDMWKPFMNVMKELSPYAMQVHDKFHLVKKLSEAIDKTRKNEIKENPILTKQKYSVMKNQENRTENQQKVFEEMTKVNLKTSEAWAVREDFRTIFNPNHWSDKLHLYKIWIENASKKNLKKKVFMSML